jgi:hypothetical protein
MQETSPFQYIIAPENSAAGGNTDNADQSSPSSAQRKGAHGGVNYT